MLSSCCDSGADDSGDVVFELCVDDQNQSTINRSNCDETILEVGMVVIEYFDVVDAGIEELPSFLERDPVLVLVDNVLGFIPLDRHVECVGQWRSKSMAEFAITRLS